ncbi:MAG: asparaginase [Epsilonproteobacteria bacterium]|nr:asparaginase [Campylobacterota bacterium]NPA63623.1 asparaginase [Campylobacterota bacterium]
MIILNTGGTFNKIYDPLIGGLVVPKSDEAVRDIVRKLHMELEVRGLIYKDSLEFDDEDRKSLLEAIKEHDGDVVVVHGTDTMERSAAFVAPYIEDRCVVFTGAMVPYSIDRAEASANLMLALAKALYFRSSGVYIAMHGIVDRYERVTKDRQRGLFVKS